MVEVGEKEKANQIEELEKRRTQLEEQIAETKLRLPAHSAKPPVMMELFALEDELETVLRTLSSLELP